MRPKDKSLESRVAKIEARNKKVELDKKWEGSYSRRALIVAFTYISIGLYMWAIGVTDLDVVDQYLQLLSPLRGFLPI